MSELSFFTRLRAKNVADGVYRVRAHFDNLPENVYTMMVKDGICILPFKYLTQSGAWRNHVVQVHPSMLSRSSESGIDFRIERTVRNWEKGFGEGQSLLGNLRSVEIATRGDEFGFIVNGSVFLCTPGKQLWTNFPNFLYDFAMMRLGEDWIAEEATSSDPHPFVRLKRMFDDSAMATLADCPPGSGVGLDGALVLWLMDFAYNLFWIDQNRGLQSVLLDRLRQKDQFWGAVHECFVAACFLRAGFTVEFEDESDRRTRHPEFVATHAVFGDRIAVEAKLVTRSQNTRFEFDNWDVPKLRLGRLLNDAARKNPRYPYVVVIDVNVPPPSDDISQTRFNNRIADFLFRYHSKASLQNPDIWNTVYFVNRPFLFAHYRNVLPVFSFIGCWSQMPAQPHPRPETAISLNIAMQSMGNITNELAQMSEALNRHVVREGKGGGG